MSLVDQINKDFIESYKARDEFKSSVLRMLKASLKNEEISKKSSLSDEDAIKVLKKEAKQRKESATEFRKANQNEVADKEDREAKLIETYLPMQLSEEETRSIAQKTIDELGVSDQSGMGKVIGSIMSKHGGEVDGSIVSKVVRELLQK